MRYCHGIYSLSSEKCFLASLQMYRKSYCTTPGVRIDIVFGVSGISKMLTFYIKVFFLHHGASYPVHGQVLLHFFCPLSKVIKGIKGTENPRCSEKFEQF